MIETSTFRVLNAKSKTVGTGFLISKTLAITCAHVVFQVGADTGMCVRIQFTDQKKIIETSVRVNDLDHDVAILQLDEIPAGIDPLRLGCASESRLNHPLYTFGYASAAGEQGIGGSGHFVRADGNFVQFRMHEADHGHSGAPLFDEKRQVVIGMIAKGKDQTGRNAETTFAIPSDLIFDLCPEIRPAETCPYLGLDTFTAETARFFFGRESLTEKLVATLRGGCRFLAVFGPSGSGKSSVVRAGLLPKPADRLFSGWQQVILRPADDPFVQLQAAGLESLDSLPERVILFVDQFEELFTLCPDATRERFVKELTAALEKPRFLLVISMRDDFYSAFNAKAVLLAQSEHLKIENVPGALQRDELLAMIERPAELTGLALEDGLDELILKDLAQSGEARSSALPLLEFALTQLWAKRRDGLLTHDAYQAIGGVTGSLARWADEAYCDLPKADQLLAESLLTSLVHLGDEAQGTLTGLVYHLPDTRKRRPLTDFDEPTRRVVKQFADRRLLITEGEMVELVHDALLHEWGRLQEWIKKNREQLRILEAVSEAANAWSATPKNADLLVHRGGRLDDALKLQARLSQQEKSYLADCKSNEQRRRRNTIAAVSVALVVIMAILVGWGWTNNQNAVELGHQVATAEEAQANAEMQKREAIKQAHIALARQLVTKAQTLLTSQNSKQIIAVLMAIQSMRLFPTGDAQQIVENNTLQRPIACMSHADDVEAVAFSPDNKYVASASADKTVRVWDVVTGKQVARMTHDDIVESVAFSPNGQYIVSRSDDSTAHVWDVATGKEIAHMKHDGKVTFAAFSPDNKYVASGSDRFPLFVVWESATGKEIARVSAGFVQQSLSLSPDGKNVASISVFSDKGVQVWETFTGKEIVHLMHHVDSEFAIPEYLTTVAFSPDSKYITFGTRMGNIRVWEISTGKEIISMKQDDGDVTSVTFSPNGKYLASSSIYTVRIWDRDTGKEIAHMTHDADVVSIAFSPDSTYIVSGSADGTARIWGITIGRERTQITHSDIVKAVAFSPNGKYIASGSLDNTVCLWNAPEPTPHLISRVGSSVTWGLRSSELGWGFPVISRDGKYFVGTSLTSSSFTEFVKSLKSLAGTNSNDLGVSINTYDTVNVWDGVTGQKIADLTSYDSLNKTKSVVFSPNSKYIVYADNYSTIHIWDIDTRKEIAQMKHGTSVSSVAVSPDSQYVASTGDDKNTRIWEVKSGKEVAHITHKDLVNSVAISPDNKYIVSGSVNGLVCVWEIATDKKVVCMIHGGDVYSVAFSPDGNYVVSGSSDQTVRVWDVVTREEVTRMSSYSVASVSFSPDGNSIIAGDTVLYWRSDDFIAKACSRIPRNLTRAEWQLYIGDTPSYQAICSDLPIEPEPTATPSP